LWQYRGAAVEKYDKPRDDCARLQIPDVLFSRLIFLADMSEPKSPSLIAREALTRLAAARLPPTPANFQAAYNEIANLPNVVNFAEEPLRKLAGALVGNNDEQLELLAALDAAITRRSWQGVQDSLLGFIGTFAAVKQVRADAVQVPVLPVEFSNNLARFVESVMPALGHESGQVDEMAGQLVRTLRQSSVDVVEAQGLLSNFSRQVSFVAEEQHEIKDSLLKLLQLIIENIGELSLDDSWLKGQVDGLLAVVAPPLTLRHLDEMERRLRDVMVKQSEAKKRSVVAQAELREMLSAFIGRLANMSDSSAAFQGKIEGSAEKIEHIKKIEDLAPLLKEVLTATREMAEDTAGARDQLKSLQEKVLATEAELVQLHLELDNASALARHDPLTDALNRKGLDEAMEREIASMRRKDTPLSVCMLDIDNFKLLNDRLGHDVGDDALKHLVAVTRSCMRSFDTLARYGGEEFVILMPDTPLAQGVDVISRLQRELTKAFFLSGREKVLITFSAGVAQLATDETGVEGMRRADQAMYLAKRAGKNRVLAA
jgi:diguanylate cyclase